MTVIFPGSFDPVHRGHIRLAAHVASLPEVNEVWLLPSRRNPLKDHAVLAGDTDRLALLRLATEDVASLHVSDIELGLPYPSYSITTLRELKCRFPDRDFRILIGSDNWPTFPHWRQAEAILRDFGLFIYPRPGYDIYGTLPEKVSLFDHSPLFPYSSTQVREKVACGDDLTQILDPRVARYIADHKLYRNETD